MKLRFLFISAMLFQILSAFATQNLIDDKGRKQGEWVKKYANGQVMYTATFKNDQPVGTMKRFYETGKLKSVQTYKKDGSSVVTIYEQDGKTISAEGSFIGQKKNGEWKIYSEGKLSLVENYIMGVKNGISKTYAKNGTVIEEVNYKDDKIDGLKVCYLEDGKKYSEVNYTNGVENGSYKLYEGLDKPTLEGQFKDGKRVGEWYVYDNDGKLTETLKYEYGKLLNKKDLLEKYSIEVDQREENKGSVKEPNELIPGASVKSF